MEGLPLHLGIRKFGHEYQCRHKAFPAISSRGHKRVLTFSNFQIVPQHSAELPPYELIPIHENHMVGERISHAKSSFLITIFLYLSLYDGTNFYFQDMTKFATNKDPCYQRVIREIRRVLAITSRSKNREEKTRDEYSTRSEPWG